MKKFTALILAVLMLFTFAACGGGETPETPDVPESTTASEAPIKGEIHGIKLEQYAEMTGEDLVSNSLRTRRLPQQMNMSLLLRLLILQRLMTDVILKKTQLTRLLSSSRVKRPHSPMCLNVPMLFLQTAQPR